MPACKWCGEPIRFDPAYKSANDKYIPFKEDEDEPHNCPNNPYNAGGGGSSSSSRISLLIVDSIITHFRSEYSGRSTLPERQQRLNNQLSKLSKIARTYKVAVIMTNQLQSNPISFGNNEKSTGSNIMGHNSTHRIRLNKSDFGNIYATIVKSPYHASDAPDAKYIITKKGIDDLPGELGQTIHY